MDNKAKKKGDVKLSLDGKEYSYPVLGGSVGPDVIDIRKLYGDTGLFTYDPGFTSTALAWQFLSVRPRMITYEAETVMQFCGFAFAAKPMSIPPPPAPAVYKR